MTAPAGRASKYAVSTAKTPATGHSCPAEALSVFQSAYIHIIYDAAGLAVRPADSGTQKYNLRAGNDAS
ncbi:hypothetical protein R80B4_02857 [Fibrobacteres bacterium R8-0-B4]